MPENLQKNTPESRDPAGSFFRQSGWLMAANVGGGALMWAVHFLSKAIPEGEYGNFGVFLAVVMVLPTLPLQMVLAQQTAAALATGKRGELSAIIRRVSWVVLFVWLVASALVLAFKAPILSHWKIETATPLYLTLVIVLFSLWIPMFSGVLQGAQDFLWLGWGIIANAFARVSIAAFAVLALHAYATGMVTGVLAGVTIAVGIVVWRSRKLWLEPPKDFDWRGLSREIFPLVLGFLGFQVLFTADTLFVKAYFSEETAGFYVSAGTLSRALMWLVLPLASVMFPRLVQSASHSERRNLVGLVLTGTVILALLGATSLSLLAPWVVRLVFKASYLHVVGTILPWYAFAMVPLAAANVLLNQLLAKPEGAWDVAIMIFLLAAGYIVALVSYHPSLVAVLQMMGGFNLVLLGLCGWFSWRRHSRLVFGPQP